MLNCALIVSSMKAGYCYISSMANEMGGAENLLWLCVKGTVHWYQGHAITCYLTDCEE